LIPIRFETGSYGDRGGYKYKEIMVCTPQCFYNFLCKNNYTELHGISTSSIIDLFDIVKDNTAAEIFESDDRFLTISKGLDTLDCYRSYNEISQYVDDNYKDLSSQEKKDKTVEIVNFYNSTL
jgi:hypothetical protein